MDWRVTTSHVYREGNLCADFLASFALNLEEGFHALQVPPEAMSLMLQADMAGDGISQMCMTCIGDFFTISTNDSIDALDLNIVTNIPFSTCFTSSAIGEEGTPGYIGPRLILFGGATALEGNRRLTGLLH
ncbi:hypothetical protein K1719_033398 [Acacia pycnantha]|nr:hypothetical protein K1719_033398 [Acacia pycnantha]